MNLQDDIRIKAVKAFNEFFDCYLKADPALRDSIGKEVIELMILKANTDTEFNRKLKMALSIAEQMKCLK